MYVHNQHINDAVNFNVLFSFKKKKIILGQKQKKRQK